MVLEQAGTWRPGLIWRRDEREAMAGVEGLCQVGGELALLDGCEVIRGTREIYLSGLLLQVSFWKQGSAQRQFLCVDVPNASEPLLRTPETNARVRISMDGRGRYLGTTCWLRPACGSSKTPVGARSNSEACSYLRISPDGFAAQRVIEGGCTSTIASAPTRPWQATPRRSHMERSSRNSRKAA